MKKLLTWGAVGLLTSAILDPVINGMLDMPIPWLRDTAMGIGGIACYSLLVKFRSDF